MADGAVLESALLDLVREKPRSAAQLVALWPTSQRAEVLAAIERLLDRSALVGQHGELLRVTPAPPR